MRLFKLKTSRLAWVFAIVTILLHLGTFYLIAAVIKNQHLAATWQNSLKIYWPALFLVQIFGQFANGSSPLFGIVLMIAAALFQWWLIFCALISLVRLYFRKPPISNKSKIVVIVGTLVVAVCFYEAGPETLGMSKYQRFRFDVSAGYIDKVRETLKHNPGFANKVQPGWGTALHEAAQMGHAEIAELLLKSGSDTHATDIDGLTPLHMAARSGQDEVIKILFKYKADVNAGDKDGKTPLWNAAAGGYTNTIALLLTNGAGVNARDKYGNCPLTGAIENNRYGVVPLLLSNGANPIIDGSIENTLGRAALQDSPTLAESLLPYFNGTNSAKYLSEAFSSAFQFGHMDVAIPISTYALHFESNSIYAAAFNGDANDVRTQLETQSDLLNSKDFLGLSPLHRAAQAGQKSILELLLEKGAAINSTDQNGNTSLHWAVFMQQSNIVETLINHKADLNLKGAGGKSPLHLAVQQRFIPIAETLLKAGANPNIAASGGETPLCIAVANGNVEAVKLLLAYHSDFGVHCYDDTLFHVWARGTANVEIAELLLANGCDVNAKGREGQTPLHALIETASWPPNQQGQIQAVQWLLDHKADVNAKNDKGQTPLSLLKWHNRGRVIEKRKDIGDLLRKYGAKE